MSLKIESPNSFSNEHSIPSHPTSENGSLRRKRKSRSKASFHFAHPPPNTFTKSLTTRPWLLLQLQQISSAGRPTPVLNVLQSASPTGMLARALPKIYGRQDLLELKEVIVVKSDSYMEFAGTGAFGEGDVSSEPDSCERREVVATIWPSQAAASQSKLEVTVISKNGTSWKSTLLPNGSYDFVTMQDSQPRRVRWVLDRKSSNRNCVQSPKALQSTSDDEKRFTFSIIHPNTRRHPVLASMTRIGIEMVDCFALPSSTSNKTTSIPSSNASFSSIGGSDIVTLEASNSDTMAVDGDLKNLILTTGICVSLREGWSEAC